jgi:hypothetical protein
VAQSDERLHEVESRLNQLGDAAPQETRRDLFAETRWVVRKLALSNPLLDFDRALFIKRAPRMLPHASDQHYR